MTCAWTGDRAPWSARRRRRARDSQRSPSRSRRAAAAHPTARADTWPSYSWDRGAPRRRAPRPPAPPPRGAPRRSGSPRPRRPGARSSSWGSAPRLRPGRPSKCGVRGSRARAPAIPTIPRRGTGAVRPRPAPPREATKAWRGRRSTSRARLPNDPDRRPLGHIQRKTVERRDGARFRGKLDAQIADLQQRAHRRVSLGSRASRSASPMV